MEHNELKKNVCLCTLLWCLTWNIMWHLRWNDRTLCWMFNQGYMLKGLGTTHCKRLFYKAMLENLLKSKLLRVLTASKENCINWKWWITTHIVICVPVCMCVFVYRCLQQNSQLNFLSIKQSDSQILRSPIFTITFDCRHHWLQFRQINETCTK